MDIIGNGVDIIKNSRINSSLKIKGFLNRIFTKKEIDQGKKIKNKTNFYANKIGLEVHAGHGMDYKTTKILNKIKQIEEFNIGHFIIGESVSHSISKVVKQFIKILR